MLRLRDSRSLLLTGLADVWSGARDGARTRPEATGLALMVFSAACFAAMAAFAKLLLPDTPTQAVVFSRGTLMALIFVWLARREGVPLLGDRPALLFLRGLLGYIALSCYFYSVQHLPLGDAVLLQYSHPVFVAVFAPLLIGERGSRTDLGLILAALVGVGLIVSPEGSVRPEAVIGVFGSMCSGLAYMTVRQLAKSEHALRILVWFPLATIPPAFVATLLAGRAAIPRNLSEVAGHLLVTTAGLLGQVALTAGLSRASAARATAITLTGPIFGLAFGYWMFGAVPGLSSIVGTAIVLGALALLGRGVRARATDPAAAPATGEPESPSSS